MKKKSRTFIISKNFLFLFKNIYLLMNLTKALSHILKFSLCIVKPVTGRIGEMKMEEVWLTMCINRYAQKRYLHWALDLSRQSQLTE